MECVRIDDEAFLSRLFIFIIYSYILIFLQVGKIKITAKQCLEILSVQCLNSDIKMTNGIRKVRQGVDIFDKRSLDSCKIHLRQIHVT